ncbi:MAG: hypothetical protein LBE36_00345 [Flavobacteriaceae bacterium]|nr:hypothetical protein [Flavobacteriaceae bacterium]
MNKSLFIGAIVSLSLVLFSCREERLSSEMPGQNPVVNPVMSKDTEMKTQFAKALAKALKDHKELRDFIKMEALKQVNRDYDVLYHVIKNKPVTTMTAMGGNTIHDLLLPYFETEAQLLEIENKLPLLTIFVPDLPEDSFSAEDWETLTEIPYVAVRTYESNDIPIYNADGENFVLDAPYIPAFPVVVVKDNERVIPNNDELFDDLDTPILTESTDDVQLRLASNNFAHVLEPYNPPPPPSGSYPRVDPIHVQAYDVYKDYTPGGWQRDFIYYAITPTSPNGVVNQTYKEELTSFKLTGPPEDVYIRIASSQDPNLVPPFIGGSQTPSQASAWTDGGFDIKIYRFNGAKNTNVAELYGGFPVAPESLFDITYTLIYINMHPPLKDIYAYIPQVTGLKMYDLYNNPENKVQFSTWNLDNYSNQWALEFEEVDLATTHGVEKTHSYKYNGNISFEPEPVSGLFKKLGLKFGVSAETSGSEKLTLQYTDVSDGLGSVDIGFDDNVVDWKLMGGIVPKYGLVPNKYNNGYIEIEVRPMRTY